MRELLKLNARKHATFAEDHGLLKEDCDDDKLGFWRVQNCGRLFYSSRAVPQSDFPHDCQTVANCSELVLIILE